MAEGAMPGAPQMSGTSDDPQHFYHQPPPDDGLDFGSQTDRIDHASSQEAPHPLGASRLDSSNSLQRRLAAFRERHGNRIRSRNDDVGDEYHGQNYHEDTTGDDTDTQSDSSESPHQARPGTPTGVSPVGASALSSAPQGSPVHEDPPAEASQAATPRRAHFPDEPAELTKIYSPPPRSRTDLSTLHGGGDSPAPAAGVPYDGEKDREPAMHRGWWQAFRTWMETLKEDFGTPHRDQDVQDLIGDIGIDVHTIRKVAGRPGMGKRKSTQNRISSLIAPSVMLARPGLGTRTESSSTVHTITSGSTTAVGSGAATPSTLRRLVGSGVDPQELSRALKKLRSKAAKGDTKQAKYVQEKSELAHRRSFVLNMVYAFMAFGAPSHRIEEYTLQLFRALNMEGRVNYTVGCTEISFINPIDPDDPFTRSAYTTIVKAQGLDIGACEVAFRIYKDVVHGDISVDDAHTKLKDLINEPSYYRPSMIVPFYGAASALASIWAYNGYWMDMIPAFILGCIVGTLQIILAARNPLYSNVLEVSAALVTSFGARAFASIDGVQKWFCFGSVAESSITTILPGYIVLCGTLELQSKSITAGATRLFYAIIYSLLLGYGMAVGAQVWLAIYPDAPTSATCPRSVNPLWKILLVPSYLAVQAVLIRSRPRQIPVQVIIGSAAYTVNYFVSQRATAQVADTASALTLGILGHLWARSQRAFAFAAVVAGIMVLVPSGLSAQGGLVAGITTPLFNNGTTSAQSVYEQNIYQSFSVGAQMIMVAVGLATGIFLSALVVYPFGRTNNALFSF